MDRRREPMTSQRKKTAPPTPRRPRSSSSSRKGLIATEKTKKQSAKKRTALDNRFHRTPTLSCARVTHAGLTAARWLPRPMAQPEEAKAAGVTPSSWFSPAKERPACQLERGVSRFGLEHLQSDLYVQSSAASAP